MRNALPILVALTSLVGCKEMRQNLRGQELSYRGAWFCAEKDCSEKQMQRSTSGTREGAVDIASVKLRPHAGLAFTAEAPFDKLNVKVEDCKGKSVELDASAIKKPGEHKIGDSAARESWMVVLDKRLDLKFGKKCAWVATVVATWSDGATFTSQAGIKKQ
jgi:hypothetical protein